MKNGLFEQAANIRYGALPKSTTYAWIRIGNDEAGKYLITGETAGTQVFRTQYDVAVDGTRYMLTAGRGKGGFNFTVFEGPLISCDGSTNATFADKYGNLDEYANRTIDVVLTLKYGESADGSGNNTTKHAARFSGVVTFATTKHAVNRDGVITTETTINAEGMWRS